MPVAVFPALRAALAIPACGSFTTRRLQVLHPQNAAQGAQAASKTVPEQRITTNTWVQAGTAAQPTLVSCVSHRRSACIEACNRVAYSTMHKSFCLRPTAPHNPPHSIPDSASAQAERTGGRCGRAHAARGCDCACGPDRGHPARARGPGPGPGPDHGRGCGPYRGPRGRGRARDRDPCPCPCHAPCRGLYCPPAP